jgi:hypothetical protein
MQQRRFYILNEDEFNSMQWQLRQAIDYCEQAVPYRHGESIRYTYPGATGYSQSAMEGVKGILDSLKNPVEFD